MKRTISFVIASAAVAMALVSCTKEITTNNEGEKGINADGTRTLTVSFATKPTKTTLSEDGITPVWAEGDKIFLADGNATDTYTVTAGQAGYNTVTITTTLQGTISAVYPADAAIEVENIITGVKVEAVQDSTFGSANICLAEEETEGVLSFENKTAVFEVKVPAHTTQLVVTSLGEIDGTTGLRGETIRPINTEGADDAAKQKITVDVTDSNDSTTCYVSVLVDETNPVLLTNLNFDAVASGTDGTQGGFSPKYLKDVKEVEEPYALEVAAGTIYSLPGEALHPYVNVNGYKWATCNVGALKPEEYGGYYQWAGTYDVTSTSIKLDWDNCPCHTGKADATGWTKYIPSDKESYWSGPGNPDNKTVLGLEDDVAYVILGGNWRMPTYDEWDKLTESSGWNWKWTQQNGVNGYKVSNDMEKFIFLPAAGCRRVYDLAEKNTTCRYWSSSLYEKTPSKVANMYFIENDLYVYYSERHIGMPIRPVSK